MKKLWMFVLIAMMTISFGVAEAQKKRKKRKKGKKTPTTEVAPSEGTATATKATPGVVTYDWGYAYFRTKVKTKEKVSKWSLEALFRVFGDVPDRSIFEVVLKQKRKTLMTMRCPAVKFLEGLRRGWQGVPVIGYVQRCKSKDLIKKTGKFKVEIHFINGDSDKKTKAATHTIEVLASKRLYPTGKPRGADLYINRNSEVLSNIMYLRTDRSKSYELPYGKGPTSRRVNLLLNATPEKSIRTYFNRAHLRCKVNGKRIKIKVDGVAFEHMGKWGRGSGAAKDKKHPTRKRGTVSERLFFTQYHVALPLYWESGGNSNFGSFTDNKGKWECEIRSGTGDSLVKLRWEVGEDGKVKLHPEQEKGLTLMPNAFLVETIIPKKSPLYTRLVPKDIEKNAFHGRGFKSKAGKNMAKAVKKKGKPTL